MLIFVLASVDDTNIRHQTSNLISRIGNIIQNTFVTLFDQNPNNRQNELWPRWKDQGLINLFRFMQKFQNRTAASGTYNFDVKLT